MKILCVGDIHERESQPVNRVDDWQETLDRKAAEILKIAKDRNVTAILQTGDFTDSTKMSDEYQTKVLKRWSPVNIYGLVTKLATGEITERDLIKEFKKGIPMIGIVGNHDQYGGTMQGFEKTALHYLSTVGLVSFVTKDKPVYFTDPKSGLKVAITGCHYQRDIDNENGRDDYVVNEKLGDYHIHLVHGMLTTKSVGNIYEHTMIDEISHTKADLTISGHDHLGFETTEKDGKLFANPGAITRLKSSAAEQARVPQVMEIEITKEDGIKLTMIPLASANNGLAVLSTKKRDLKRDIEGRIEAIQETLEGKNEESQETILDLIQEVERTTLSEDIHNQTIRKAADRLIAVMDENTVAPLKNKEPVKIKSLELINFQSHKQTLLDFSDGLNVIIGESDNGKTSIMRAFRFIYGEYDCKASEFIRHGEDFASVSLVLENGYEIERKVERKAGGFNGYFIKTPTGEVVKTNTKGLTQVRLLLGYNQMIVDGKNRISVNFLDQDDKHFLISKDITSTYRAKLAGSITKAHVGDNALQTLEQEVKKATTKLQLSKERVASKELEILQMQHVKPLGILLIDAKAKLAEIEDLQNSLNEVKELAALYLKQTDMKNKYERFIEESNKVLSHREELNLTIHDSQRIQPVKEAFVQMRLLDDKQLKLTSFIKQSKETLASKLELTEISIRLQEIERAKELGNSFSLITEKGKNLSNYLNKTKELIQYKESIQDANTNLKRIELLKEFEREFALDSTQVAKLNCYIEKATPLKEASKEIKQILLDVHSLQKNIEVTDKALTILKRGTGLKNFINERKELLETSKESIMEVELQLSNHSSKKELLKNSLALIKDIEWSGVQIDSLKKKKEDALKEYTSFIEEMGICPVCKQSISEEQAYIMAKGA